MIEHIITAAPAFHIDGGRLLGSVGSGGLALALTGALIAGTHEPKKGAATGAPGGAPASGGKKDKLRRKLDSSEAKTLGVTAGTLYATAGSIWTVGPEISDAFTSMFTNGGFGQAEAGGVSLFLAGYMYFRDPTPGKSALVGILAAGVWATAGGIWGLPQALILTLAHAIGVL